MSVRQTGVLVAVALGALLGPRTQAQKAEEPPPAVRYVAVPSNDKHSRVVVMDTATGHCWSKDPALDVSQEGWLDPGSPARPKKGDADPRSLVVFGRGDVVGRGLGQGQVALHAAVGALAVNSHLAPVVADEPDAGEPGRARAVALRTFHAVLLAVRDGVPANIISRWPPGQSGSKKNPGGLQEPPGSQFNTR
jgi:hypothetical protein